MKRNKIIIIVTIIIILAIAGILGILYAKTDMFKDNKTLFYKYLAKSKIVDQNAIQVYQKIAENILNHNYTSAGDINCSMAASDNSTNIANIQNLFTIKYNTLENKSLDQSYADYTVISNNQNLITLRYLKDGNTYALKADNVVNKYLAVENSNLKEFFRKLGVKDTTAIPDSIPQADFLQELLTVDPELLNNIKATYFTLLNDKLSNNDFTKITNSNETITLELSLSEQEVMNIVKAALETLKNDDATIQMIIEKASLLEYELNIDSFKTMLQEEIDNITNQNYSTEDGYFKLGVIENGKDTIGLETQFSINSEENKRQMKYRLDFSEENKIIIYADDGEGNNIKNIITFGYETNKFETNVDLVKINEDNTETGLVKIQYQINNYETNNITQSMAMKVVSEEKNSIIQIDLNSSTELKQDIAIEKITDQNATKLNNLSSNDLNDLIRRIILRLQYLYGDQINNIM